jgi:6,7-dimethyl-8-ribityllumazine synthase
MTKALIIEADFYTQISGLLRAGAISVLEEAGIEHDVVVVPGALEIPAALLFAVENNLKTYDCFVVLGCVIRGETSHYDIVCNESARGLYNLSLQYSLALGNGILTVENEEQAIERADPQKKDKGGAAAKAALHMLAVKKKYAA